MLKSDWNSLRSGDALLVHDPRDTNLLLVGGVVSMVQVPTGKKGVNRIGIRVGDGDESQVVWPSYLAVHRDGGDLTATCWRCAAIGPIPAASYSENRVQ